MVPDLVMLDCLDFAKDPFREARAKDFVLRSDSIQFATSYLPVIRKLQNYYSSLKDQKWGDHICLASICFRFFKFVVAEVQF